MHEVQTFTKKTTRRCYWNIHVFM